jgi:CO/xanthine dehydrogenase Mo-binding subunit
LNNDDSRLFIDDFFPKGFYHVITIRSPVSSGKIVKIETPKMPGTYTLITAADIEGMNKLEQMDVPILAGEKISYIGEAAAILAGPDISKLIEYAEASIVHVTDVNIENSKDNISASSTKRSIEKGTLKKVFKKPNTIIEGTYKTGIQEHWYSDPHGAIAYFENETLIIQTSTQWPFHVKRSVSSLLNMNPESVVVRPASAGIHLDGKLWYPSLISCHAALAASIIKKPVKLCFTRDEDFLYSPKRNASEISMKSALNKKGELLRTDIQVKNFGGSYEIFGDETLDRFCLGSLGSYRTENVQIEGETISESIPPQGPFAGFGLSQGFFAAERHFSEIADTLNIDPMEWRQKNILLRGSEIMPGISIKENITLDQLLETAASMSDYHRKWASYELLRKHRRQNPDEEKHEPFRGIGVSLAYQGSGFINLPPDKFFPSVELTMDKDSILEIKTSMVSTNNDYTVLWKNIAAEILSMDLESINITLNSTELVPDSGPSSLSRNITILTKLIERACSAIRKQRFRDPLPITVTRSYTPLKTKGWNNALIDQNALSHLSWAAAVVEVEIDPIEYIPQVRGIWTSIDGGKILSETRSRFSMKTSIMQALGWASLEKISYEDGKLLPHNSSQYAMPSVADAPPINIDFSWNDSLVPRGIGELPFNTIPAAYAQALTQAADHSFNTLPITPLDIWNALSMKKMMKEDEA